MTKDWSLVQDEIRRLYHEQDRPLNDVMRVVKGKFGFIASERSYRSQLVNWGYTKYSTQSSPKPKKVARSGKHPARSARRQNAIPMTNPAVPSISQSGLSEPSSVPLSTPSFASLGDATRNEFFFSPSDVMVGDNTHAQLPFLGIEQPPLAPSNFNSDGRTALHQAVIDQNEETVTSLLHLAVAVDIKDNHGNTPLHYSAISHIPAIVNLLLRFGAEVNTKGQLGRSALHLAVLHAEVAVTKMLLREGADASAQDEKGDTPLHLALGAGGPNPKGQIGALFNGGSDPNRANNFGITPFLKLLSYPEEKSLGYIPTFLERGASTTTLTPNGATPFQLFLSHPKKKWIGWRYGLPDQYNAAIISFLNKGASIVTRTAAGDPFVIEHFRGPRVCGVDCRSLHVSLRLCDQASPTLTLDNGNTLLHEISAIYTKSRRKIRRNHLPRQGTRDFLEAVLQKGTDPNHRNHAGETALHILCVKCPMLGDVEEAMTILLAHGADPSRDYRVIFEAAKRFPTAPNTTLLHPLLRAFVRGHRMQRHPSRAEGKDVETNKEEWWVEWEQVARAGDWDGVFPLLQRHSGSQFSREDKAVMTAGYSVLAEIHLQDCRDRLRTAPDETAVVRAEAAKILRSCRAHNLPVDMKYFDFLLDLC